jgi:regulator of ribonuclease activity A
MKDSITDLLPELCDRFPDLIEVADPMFINFGGREAFGGEIVTVKACEDNSMVKQQLELPGSGKVLIVDGAGSMRRSMLGDMLAESAVENGWEGVIVYGGIRDVNAISMLDLGVLALGAIPLKTIRRGVGEMNIPVTFAGVTFHPGHYVYADNNGLIVSPEDLTLPEMH